MKSTVITTSLLALVSILPASAEKNTKAATTAQAPAAPASAAALQAAYARCAAYDDITTAAGLAYQLIEADPASAGKWKEELAKIYFASNRQVSCLRVCEDLIKNHGGDGKSLVLEMRALCEEALGKKTEASASWKVLWDKDKNPVHAVRLAGTYFDTDKLDEADKIIAAGLAAKDADTATITLPKTRDEMQKIPAAAALHNLKALILTKRDPKAKEPVKAELDAALKLAPDFELAKRNLQNMK